MKKETFTEKLIKRTYGISDPLDEYKRREADRIGNQVFIVLFYLMIFGNLIPLVLAYKFPQLVALVYPPLIYEISTKFTYLSSFVQFSAHLHHRFRELAIQRDIPPSSLYSST